MSSDELDALGGADGDGLGCPAFGHFASPFVDRELPPTEMDRFEVHLPGCEPCSRLLVEYRAIEEAATRPTPEPASADWDQAWAVIRAAIEAERRAAAESPLAPVLRFFEGLRRPLPRTLRPLAYLVASLLLVLALFAVQRSASDPGEETRLAELSSEEPGIECADGYVAVAYTIPFEDELVSVQYCAFVGADPATRG